jgi:hypothetical protein
MRGAVVVREPLTRRAQLRRPGQVRDLPTRQRGNRIDVPRPVGRRPSGHRQQLPPGAGHPWNDVAHRRVEVPQHQVLHGQAHHRGEHGLRDREDVEPTGAGPPHVGDPFAVDLDEERGRVRVRPRLQHLRHDLGSLLHAHHPKL